MGLDPSILHAPQIARRLSKDVRVHEKVTTPEEWFAAGEAKNEKDLQDKLVQLLYRRGYQPRNQRMDRRSNIAIGLPDIQWSCYGRTVEWEVKMPGKQPEAEQVKMMAKLQGEPNNAIVRVIRSYREGLDHVLELERLFKQQALRQIDGEVIGQ